MAWLFPWMVEYLVTCTVGMRLPCGVFSTYVVSKALVPLLFRGTCSDCIQIYLCRYKTLLQDCHHCYVSQRGLLLTPTVTATIEELKKVHGSDYSGLVSMVIDQTGITAYVDMHPECSEI